ncbi:DUF427-domain-containing protein [Acaromyces ingoldii]|uniref:DUF427-domain-containing protein n=1 Tax=Acaromyces ingoldii TaxID=215250 RepID=A0A316YJH4_9BASI|nr:DUF427-domain-containing protein [Acaromyces ingoldii]PWN89342.1 DUF427-domain-containing protein [Acaromyces ingoldii]
MERRNLKAEGLGEEAVQSRSKIWQATVPVVLGLLHKRSPRHQLRDRCKTCLRPVVGGGVLDKFEESQSGKSREESMPPRPVESVWNYPRPPALQPTTARLRVVWRAPDHSETVVADTTQGYRVLETSHPPTYYFPPSDVNQALLAPSAARRTWCEWKGQALYHDLKPTQASTPLVKAKIWSYPSPTPGFAKIKDYMCFYASSGTDAAKYVDEDEVAAQEGDFYGSWITPEITGGDRGFKGGPGTWGW